MVHKSLRDAIWEILKTNPDNALNAIKRAGGTLDEKQAENIRNGNLDAFDDPQLALTFNARVLGALGIDASQFLAPDNEDYGGR